MRKDVFGLVYAGEENINLRELVNLRSVSALPVGGRYRVIDFTLSNMVNSGIRNIGIIPKKNYQSLIDHVGSGKDWNLDRKTDGLFILPPYDTFENTGSYNGLVDTLKGASAYIRRAPQKYCLLTGSYTLFNCDYYGMFEQHMDTGADITMLYNEEPTCAEKGAHFKDLRLTMNDDGRITDMQYRSEKSSQKKVGMDVYLVRKDLLEYLIDDAMAHGKYNFVTDVLIKNLKHLKIYGCKHTGHVARLSSAAAYQKLNMDFLKPEVQDDLFCKERPIYTKVKDGAPAKYGSDAQVKNSLIGSGCVIEGEVENSVLFRGVYVGKGAKIKNSIVMQDSRIYENTSLDQVIVDKRVNVRPYSNLVGSQEYPLIIPKGAVV